MIKNLIIFALLLTVFVLFFSLINYENFQQFSYPVLANVEKSLDYLIAKSEIIEELLLPARMYIADLIQKTDLNSRISRFKKGDTGNNEKTLSLPYRDTISPVTDNLHTGKQKTIQKGISSKESSLPEKYAMVTLINSFQVKGKLINEKDGNLIIELDGLPVEFSSTEIQSVRYLSPQEYSSLMNIVADKSSQDKQLP